MDFKKMEDGFRMILEGMGEDPNREGLIDTPKRVAKMYAELMTSLTGEMKAEDILKTRFHEKYDEMIIVPDIEFASMCEHHFLPFTGKAHVAYIPGDCVVGLSKIPRVVEFYARFPQIQERMTRQIAELIQKVLQPKGVAVVLEASHMCMTMRGVKKPGAMMVTTQLLGRFKSDERPAPNSCPASTPRVNLLFSFGLFVNETCPVILITGLFWGYFIEGWD